MIRIRYLILACFVLGFPLVSPAQFQPIKPEVFWGASGGVTFSNVGFQPSVQQTQRMGYMGGLTFRYIAEWYAGLVVEANYAQAGWKEDFKELDYKYDRAINYIEIPAMAHIYFGKKNFRFFINLGPKVAYAIGYTESANFDFDGSVKNNGNWKQYGKKIEKPFDYGITGGGGFELRTKAGCFLIEGRYYFGLSDIFNSNIADPFTGSPNQQIMAKLTYLIKMK